MANLIQSESHLLHTPGSIQPHGILFSLTEPNLIITHVSQNIAEYLGISPQSLLNQPIEKLLSCEQINAIQQTLYQAKGNSNSCQLSFSTPFGKKEFEGSVHRLANMIILELEPKIIEKVENLPDFFAWVSNALANLQKTSNLSEFLHLVASEVKNITQFDRVMVYQFDAQDAGEVVAEAKREDLYPYLGLHYPAPDIPEESRKMYLECRLRYIPHLNAPPVDIVAAENAISSLSVDLTCIHLRSVDTCCVAYHHNMGVAALLVISLIKDGKLWGLVSCHHQTPKYLPHAVRVACDLLGQFASLELANKISQDELDDKIKLRSLHSQVLEAMAQKDNFREALLSPFARLLELVNAQGAAISLDDEIILVGQTPRSEFIDQLIEWIDPQVTDSIFYTDSLSKVYPAAAEYKNVASGVLLLRISQVRRYYLLWFRPEVIQTVNWAGNPLESFQLGADGNLVLCPRKSFELWQETVRFVSKPWKMSEVESAIEFRNAIIGLILTQADELAKLNQELERSNLELASFAFAASHDLKEPLRGIHNYSVFMLEDYTEVLDEIGIERLQTLVRLTQRMESLIDVLLKYSRLGQAELNLHKTDLNTLLRQVIDVFCVSYPENDLEIRLPRSLPLVRCDAILINEVFSNLLSNAFKYNNKAEKWVEIGYLEPREQVKRGWIDAQLAATAPPVFYVKDNGIGIRDHHQETIFRLFKRLHAQNKFGGGIGAGLTITKKIVERHGGIIWAESIYREGTIFYFTLESYSIKSN
ncbi:cyanobacterial phytochrome A [Aphanothece hegewaldii CCALA 016]|uniref:histidine kinase n=1 Tax=Aphanothece hegewaldii CCALA 016 TaxID=2107694 RepID=A0A2T1M491_9CHRO|nr:ATP-binding protein [Aphanothece hegewaldii]PSF39590.1 cyanobacterial phytochrome A [Aphanothece hegewaldii CCALA 016]